MRLAHLILVHNNPPQLERLVKRLICPATDIYIHLDKKCDISGYIHLQALENVFFIKARVTVTWANFSVMRATLNAMAEILRSGKQYSHINLLSGADYPLKSAGTIRDFLFANTDKSFMRYRHVYNEWEEARSRFTLYSLGDYNFPLKYNAQRLLNKIRGERKLPNGLQPYGFSQWLTITPVCAQYVIDYLEENPRVERFFRMCWGADELVFQTVLINSHLKDTIVNDHLRYIRFVKRASSPDTLTMADKEILVNSGKFYARKFSGDVDADILDYLDEVVEKEIPVGNA